MNDEADEVALLIEEAVMRLLPWRRTFTEKEALGLVWDAGYEIAIQSDARFVLAQEDWKQPGHWRLINHTLANNRLLNDLLSGSWDGQDLDRKLVALDAEDQMHYVFCPIDPRLTLNKHGFLEATDHERNVSLSKAMKKALDELGEQLLTHWRETGAEPWTVRAITEELKQLGWRDGEKRNAWLSVRSWLLNWPQVLRVGQDYWLPAEQLPQEIKRTRLQVMPVRVLPLQTTEAESLSEAQRLPQSPEQALSLKGDESQVILSGDATAARATWSVSLRTVNLIEGFLHVPASARNVYPPPAIGEEQSIVLRGLWFADNTHFWLWLDRAKNQLYGPALADQLAWLEAGDRLRVDWAPDIIVMCQGGHDELVQAEEARLVDLEELSALRGGLGESYRRSIQAILANAPEGMTFAEVVNALWERQHHKVHCGTVRALLYNGGFVRKDHRWFAAPASDMGARQLRTAFVEALSLQSKVIKRIAYHKQTIYEYGSRRFIRG